MQFSIIIPTYKRPDALAVTVDSVLAGSCLPSELVIIDDDTISSTIVTSLTSKSEKKGVQLKYHQKDHTKHRRGLSESKNWAAELASNDIIFYLDDDVILDQEYCAQIMKVWETEQIDTALIGVGGRISNNRPTSQLEKIYRRIFGLTGDCDWDVNSVGFQVWDEGVTETQKGYYIHGGVSSYRRELLTQFPFAVFSGGRTGLEDVEHCLRTKNAGYHFFYVPSAHLTHHPTPSGREVKYLSGKKESINRRQIWQWHCSHSIFSRIYFAWASIGWISKKVISRQWHSSLGLVVGLFVSKSVE